MRRLLSLPVALALSGWPGARLVAQAVPEGSQATKVQAAYRRTPSFGFDPFRHVSIPHWGLVFSVGASGGNNTLNLSDVGALTFLSDSSKNPQGLVIGDLLDAATLMPRGSGLAGVARGDGAAYLGGPLGKHLSIGVSARGSGYGTVQLDEDIVALLRDGNGARQDFSLGNSRAVALAGAEAGAHAVIRLGPLGSVDGAHLNLGFGARYVRPFFYAVAKSALANGGTVRVTGDSVAANIQIEAITVANKSGTITNEPFSDPDIANVTGSGIASDFLVRLEWPTSGLALEAMVANVGKVTVQGLNRWTEGFQVNTTKLQDVKDKLDSTKWSNPSAITADVTLPRTVRFMASSWANRILQIDLSATLPVTGDFASALEVGVGTTWRFIRTLPLRAGVVLGGDQGIGYAGGVAIEGRTMFLQLAGQSLGGLLKNATGVGARFELGLFF